MVYKGDRPPPTSAQLEQLRRERAAFVPVVRAWAESVPHVRRVWLFGSFVHERHARHDLDVAVELVGWPEGEPASFWAFAPWARELERLLGGAVEVDMRHYAGETLHVVRDGLAADEPSEVARGVREHGLVVFDGRRRQGSAEQVAELRAFIAAGEQADPGFKPRMLDDILA